MVYTCTFMQILADKFGAQAHYCSAKVVSVAPLGRIPNLNLVVKDMYVVSR